MGYTTADRRERALKVIAQAKRPRRSTSTLAVANALATLNSLDDKRYSVTLEKERDGGWSNDSSHKASIHARIAGSGISLNGELVAVTDPPAAETHDANLGWREPVPDPKEQFNRAMSQTSETLGRLVRWMATGTTLESIGLRAVALGSVIAPEAFEDCNGSQQSIARKFGLTRAAVQQRVSELRDIAPSFQSRNMRGQDVREASRQRALQQHQRAGHRMHTNGRSLNITTQQRAAQERGGHNLKLPYEGYQTSGDARGVPLGL